MWNDVIILQVVISPTLNTFPTIPLPHCTFHILWNVAVGIGFHTHQLAFGYFYERTQNCFYQLWILYSIEPIP